MLVYMKWNNERRKYASRFPSPPRLYFVKAPGKVYISLIENFNRFIGNTYIFETKIHQTNSSYIMSINSIKTYFYMKNNNYILKSFQNLLKVILWY